MASSPRAMHMRKMSLFESSKPGRDVRKARKPSARSSHAAGTRIATGVSFPVAALGMSLSCTPFITCLRISFLNCCSVYASKRTLSRPCARLAVMTGPPAQPLERVPLDLPHPLPGQAPVCPYRFKRRLPQAVAGFEDCSASGWQHGEHLPCALRVLLGFERVERRGVCARHEVQQGPSLGREGRVEAQGLRRYRQ